MQPLDIQQKVTVSYLKLRRDFAILTDEIRRHWSGTTTRQYKKFKGLKKKIFGTIC